jgi:hypothetical protein
MVNRGRCECCRRRSHGGFHPVVQIARKTERRQCRIPENGDYNNSPPKDEHEGLRRYSEERSGDPVVIPSHLRPVIGTAIVRNLTEHGHRLLAVAVAGLHSHILTELPDDVGRIKIIIGWAKQKSSVAVTDEMPGSIWSEGETYKAVDSRAHLLKINIFPHIPYRFRRRYRVAASIPSTSAASSSDCVAARTRRMCASSSASRVTKSPT